MFRRITSYAGKRLKRQSARLFARVDQPTLAASFRRLGLEQGTAVCAHASLSRLGEVVGGADAVIDALMETVGREGCIMMPTFPMTGSMESYIDEGGPFDVRSSPSRVGRVTEVFRTRPDVLRSLHPTNAVAAWGRGAEDLLRDHEKSPSPYGMESPYGRLAERDHSFVLMLETHIHSLLHHIQERVEMPTLFLPGEREAAYIDHRGKRHTTRTRVMRPRIPYFVAIPSASGPEPDWAILHDYCLMFPHRREAAVHELGYRFEGYPRLHRRRADLEEAGILTTTRIGRGEVGLLRVKRFIAYIEPEFRELIERFRPHYDPDRIAALDLPYS